MSNEVNKNISVETESKTESTADTAINEEDLDLAPALFTHTFKKPFTYEGKTYETMSFDFDSLNGKDVLAIMQEIRLRGISLAARTFDVEYQYRYAARCCKEKIGSDVIAALPARDFDRICGAVQRFLLRSAL